jgi:hypothetical protein
MSDDLDLDFRPKSYFRPEKLEKYLLSKVKGAVLRKKLKALFDEGRHHEVRDLVGDAAFSVADRKALESFHPMFMGGNYLPDTEDGEVEIARISIQSTTFDVTSVYAKPVDGAIHYRVVDEYGGDTLQGPSEATTSAPMTLGDFAEFFLTAWPLIDVLEMNYEDNVDGALGFFSADSDFYPDLDRLCRQRVREHFPKPDFGDECPFCGNFNSPAADQLCEHAVAWVWDGHVETLAEGRAFEVAFKGLAELHESADEGSPTRTMLEVQANRSQARQNLIEAAALPVDEVLETLMSAEAGYGWSTDGPLGGSGYTVYVGKTTDLIQMTAECQSIVEACKLNIKLETDGDLSLERLRPGASIQWQFVASGFWYEDMYHSGHIAYYIANPAPSCWCMEACERNAILDNVTEEDVEDGRLNDDQIQAMWGQTLEEAQNEEYRHIVAWTEGVALDVTAAEMAAVLYKAVCKGGGNEINEPDDHHGLLEI